MNDSLIRRVLILTKSMVTKNNFKKNDYQCNDFESKFNQENYLLGQELSKVIQNKFMEV